VLVLGANLAVDRTLRMAQLVPGQVIRPREAVATAGGKAVNVVRAARAHGIRAVLVANLPGRAGRLIAELLADEGHDLRPIVTTGEARAALIILEDSGRTTVINEPGPLLTRDDAARLLAAVGDELATGRHGVVVATGSLPPGAPVDLYLRVVDLAHAAGSRCIVDAAGDALAATLPHGPDVVSPNLAEAEVLLLGADGEEVDPEGDDVRARATAAAAQLVAAGARAAVVSAGRHGLAGHDEGGGFWVDAPAVTVRNAIGAGDSLVAGLGAALERGRSFRDATALGVATASASVAHDLAGGVEPVLFNKLLKSVRVIAA
jgi:1-phosphofructokinase family hexose kinase